MTTLVVSTSSPVASAALFDGVRLVRAAESPAGERRLSDLVRDVLGGGVPGRVAADAGPGGFTAVRAGVAFSKALAWALAIPAAGLSAFDLIAAERTVALPATKGRWHVRVPGRPPVLADSAPAGAAGYRLEGGDVWPLAERAGPLLAAAAWTDAARLLPEYLAEPSISQPRRPYRGR